MTANGTAQHPTWYGLRVNGDMVARIMNTIGINFDWGTGGTLKLGGAGNGNGLLEVYDANNQKIGGWDNTGIDATGDFVIEKIFNNKKMQTYIGDFKARDYNIVDGNSLLQGTENGVG